MTHPSDPSPPGETENPNDERWICACSIEGDPGHHRVKLCRGHQEIVDRTVEDLKLRIAGLEALLVDAQEEIAAKEQESILLSASLRKCEAALRPFAEAYRNAKAQGAPCAELLAGEEKGKARVGHFWRAAELIPEENT
jgi:hypothetical protein